MRGAEFAELKACVAVLERASLVVKQRQGREQIVHAAPATLEVEIDMTAPDAPPVLVPDAEENP